MVYTYYGYRIPRDPVGTTYYSSNYVTPTYFSPTRTYTYTAPVRSYSYTLPARTNYYGSPRSTYYSSYESPSYVPLGDVVVKRVKRVVESVPRTVRRYYRYV